MPRRRRGLGFSGSTTEEWPIAARRMVAEIAAEASAVSRLLGKDQLDPRVLAALERVPRHEFVPPEFQAQAYDNTPLPIGHGQTISQPFVVAVMSDLLALEASARVLEIGTGSGYQAAVLANLAAQVFSIEVVPALAALAAARLGRLGYHNVQVRAGDGFAGWPEAAPFDGIILTAAPTAVPPLLLQQLRPGARLVAPIGEAHATQMLTLYTRHENGRALRQEVLPVAFVPMVAGT